MIKQFLLASALVLPTLCHAQLSFEFRNGKAGFQTGPKQVSYEGGIYEVILKDGSYAPSVCAPANPGASPVPANPLIPCPLGTNAWITGYGEAAGLTGHWSLASTPIAAVLFEINRPDLFQVLQAPPSLMARPQALPVIDKGLNIGYSYLAPPYRQYRIAEYIHRKEYMATPSERKRHDKTVPPGSYVFGYPQKLTVNEQNQHLEPRIFTIPIDSGVMPESYPGMTQSNFKAGFNYTNGEEDRKGVRKDGYWTNGMLELDPVFPMKIEWEGINNGVNTNSGVDRMFLWVEFRRSADPLQPPAGGDVLYPVPGLPVSYEIPVDRMLLGFEILPPFYHSWIVGDEVVLYTRFERNFLNGNTVKDRSFRVWGLPIRFVTSYAGFSLTQLPPDTTDALRSPNADFDLDGYSNFLEYAANTDPNSIIDTPPTGFPNLTTTVIGGKLSATVPKRPNVGGSLRYDMQWSSDFVTWENIDKVNDPIWDVIETGDELTATAKVAGVPFVAFVRAKLTLRN